MAGFAIAQPGSLDQDSVGIATWEPGRVSKDAWVAASTVGSVWRPQSGVGG
jgi:hypothetical protein